MDTYEGKKLLQILANENEYHAYKAMYEAASSALSELEKSFTQSSNEQTDALLKMWSRLQEHICSQLDGSDLSIAYEAGKLSGIISTFERLYRKKQEDMLIDAAIAELLSKSKPASKQVMRILYEARKHDEWAPWVPKRILEEKSGQSPTSLSNIMKRLLRAQAVELYKEGREVSYCLTSAGVRYYEKSISPSMNDPVVIELDLMNEKMACIQNAVSVLTEQMNLQTSSFDAVKNKAGDVLKRFLLIPNEDTVEKKELTSIWLDPDVYDYRELEREKIACLQNLMDNGKNRPTEDRKMVQGAFHRNDSTLGYSSRSCKKRKTREINKPEYYDNRPYAFWEG